jgi:hypothetical protein
MPSFNRSTCLVPDEIRDGRLYHAVRYEHDYAHLVDLNDTDKEKTFIKEHPEEVEREFTLRAPPPSKRNKNKRKSGDHGKPTDPIPERSQKIPRGALRRAITAGLIPPGIYQAILDE